MPKLPPNVYTNLQPPPASSAVNILLLDFVNTSPGHTPGGLCFVTDAGVFCGDTIFAGSIGRTDFPGGNYEKLIASIRSNLLTLPDDTLLHPGHGPATTIGLERASNPFLT